MSIPLPDSQSAAPSTGLTWGAWPVVAATGGVLESRRLQHDTLRAIAVNLTGSRLPELAAALGIAFASGCDYPLGIGRAFLDGDWAYEAATVTDAALDCSITGLILSIDQDGSTFAGVAEGGSMVCTDPSDLGATVVTRSLEGSPISGEVRGDRIEFTFGSGDIRHVGEVEDRAMAGTVTIDVDSDGSALTLEGTFVAARPPRTETN